MAMPTLTADSYRGSCPSRNVAVSFEQSLYEGHGRSWVESDLERNHPFSQWSDDMLFFSLASFQRSSIKDDPQWFLSMMRPHTLP